MSMSDQQVQAQMDQLISKGNVIQEPAVPPGPGASPMELAQYQSIQLAKQMQSQGVPMTREQFSANTISQYGTLVQQQFKEQEAKQAQIRDIQTKAMEEKLPQRVPLEEVDSLATADSSIAEIDRLMALHHAAVQAHVGGHWFQEKFSQASPEGAAFDAQRNLGLMGWAKSVGGNSGRVDNQDLNIASTYVPQIQDSEPVAQQKAQIMKDQIRSVAERKMAWLKGNNYDTSGLEAPATTANPSGGPMTSMRAAAAAELAKTAAAPGVDSDARKAALDHGAAVLQAATTKIGAGQSSAAATNQAVQENPTNTQPIIPRMAMSASSFDLTPKTTFESMAPPEDTAAAARVQTGDQAAASGQATQAMLGHAAAVVGGLYPAALATIPNSLKMADTPVPGGKQISIPQDVLKLRGWIRSLLPKEVLRHP
jgi:hypothetical protein